MYKPSEAYTWRGLFSEYYGIGFGNVILITSGTALICIQRGLNRLGDLFDGE